MLNTLKMNAVRRLKSLGQYSSIMSEKPIMSVLLPVDNFIMSDNVGATFRHFIFGVLIGNSFVRIYNVVKYIYT